MSKKEGYIVDLNRMYRYEKDGSFPHPVALMENGKEYYAAFSNGSLCYNKAFYQLYLEDTELVALASGEVVESYVSVSKKTDFDGTESPVGITDTLDEIKPNYSLTEERTGTFSVTQKVSNFTLTGTYRQRKDSYHDEYYDLRVTRVDCPTIPASGEARPLTVYYSATVIRRYESGKVEPLNDATGSTTSFSSVKVNTQQGASFNHSTGWLSASNLGTEEKAETVVATVTSVSISAYGMSLTWTGSQQWKQEANVKTAIGDPTYNVSLTVDGVDDVLWDSTYVNLVASATKTQNYIYTSNPDKLVPEKTAATGAITASDGATVSPASITGSGKTVKLSFSANSTTEEKTHKATLTAGGKKAEATVTQQAAKEDYYWETPVATSLSYGQIPASGAAIPIYVNFTQNYIKKIGHNTSPEKVYNTYSVAISLTGSKPNGSTATVSGGTVGASSLGTTLATSTTPQYNITGGTYKAADGNTYNFSLTGQVVQATNTKGTVSTAYSVGLSPASHALAASGGTVYFTVSALKTDTYTWSSGSPGKDVAGGTASISATGGTINPNSVYNGGSVSFYKGENTTSSPLSYTVTASYQGKTASSTVTQGAASFIFNYATPGTVGSSGGEYRVYVNSYMNGASLKPTATVSGSATVKAVNIVSNPTAGNIELVLDIPANTGSERTFTVTVTQPHSNDKLEIKLDQAKYEEQFSLSLASGAYFKKTDTDTYQFNGSISVQSAVTKTVYGDWYYTVINEEGMPMGSAYKDTKGTQTLSITSSTKTISYTGWSVRMNETSSASFAGFRVEFRDSSSGKTYFTDEVYDIR